MSKRETLNRHRLIISKLRRSPSSFEKLKNFIELESEIMGDSIAFSIRTFQRDIVEIASLYDIEIKYNRSSKLYAIHSEGNINHNERLMEAFETFTALNLSDDLSNHFIVEKRKPLGTQHLYGMLHAIKNSVAINFTYEKYFDDFTTNRTVHAIAIKEARYRFYLLALDTKDDKIKAYALDRISDLKITQQKFLHITNYNAEQAFIHSFGIIAGDDTQPQKIILQFTPSEAKYIKSLPLHHSQKLISEAKENSIFEFYLLPTYDFIMELLSIGEKVKVLAPESLKKEMIEKLTMTLNQYK